MHKKIINAVDKLYHDMAIVELKLQNSISSDSKITYNDMLYLDIIRSHSGEYTASQIADMLHVARPSVTQKINELEKKGYIYKEQSNNDKRVYYLHIKEDDMSKEYHSKCEKIEEKVINKICDTYSKEDIDKLCEIVALIGDMYMEEIK